MMARRVDARRDAPALRFLLLCVGGWIVLRLLMLWNPAVPAVPAVPEGARAPWTIPAPFAVPAPRPDRASAAEVVLPRLAAKRAAPPARTDTGFLPPGDPGGAEPPPPARHGVGADRHSLRLALIARLLPPSPGGSVRSAAVTGGPVWLPGPLAERAAPGRGKPFWIRRQLSGWSLGGWLYFRGGDRAATEGIGAGSQLGGSQAGLRLVHGFGDTGRLRAYGRGTIAMRRADQRELALGLAFEPLAHVPLDVAIEQRVAAGKGGRTALAAMVSGGVSDIALPGGFRLDAYGQAGIVGARRRDGFADGAVVIDRHIGGTAAFPVRLGALAAGSVQPGAGRVDVGPRLTLRLPDVGEGSRIALDWRQRVAGDARPESGLALTLAADF